MNTKNGEQLGEGKDEQIGQRDIRRRRFHCLMDLMTCIFWKAIADKIAANFASASALATEESEARKQLLSSGWPWDELLGLENHFAWYCKLRGMDP